MPITIRLQDIDEALENLRYKSETTLKSKLIRSIRSYYRDEEAAESLPAIDMRPVHALLMTRASKMLRALNEEEPSWRMQVAR